jgi:hypothetical protein
VRASRSRDRARTEFRGVRNSWLMPPRLGMVALANAKEAPNDITAYATLAYLPHSAEYSANPRATCATERSRKSVVVDPPL